MRTDMISLADGRWLRWYEFGDPDGSPVIYTAGTPVSGLGGKFYDDAAREAGLRWIAPDKPGYGGSDYQRKRSIVGWADDLAALAGHLGLDRFALAGESGGGPFTLAAAHRFARRVSVVALIAPAGRPDPAAKADPAEGADEMMWLRAMFWLAKKAPVLNTVPVAAMRWEMLTPSRRERSLRRELAAHPPAAHPGLRVEFEAVADALRPGTRATVQETALLARPWGFPPGEVRTPVHLWHGMRDRNVPIAGSRRLARELPDATLHVSESSDHDIGRDRGGEIMSVLAAHAKPGAPG